MKYIKVKFLKAHPEFSYSAGNVGIVEDEKAAQLLNKGYIMLLPDDSNEGADNTLPEDFPARDILFAEGFDTALAVKGAGEAITDVKGIGKGTYKQIVAYFEKTAS